MSIKLKELKVLKPTWWGVADIFRQYQRRFQGFPHRKLHLSAVPEETALSDVCEAPVRAEPGACRTALASDSYQKGGVNVF